MPGILSGTGEASSTVTRQNPTAPTTLYLGGRGERDGKPARSFWQKQRPARSKAQATFALAATPVQTGSLEQAKQRARSSIDHRSSGLTAGMCGGGGGGFGSPLTASWRALAAAALALWLLPVLLALALLWLPLLCCAVAAVRFRRARKSMAAASRGSGSGRGGSSRSRAADAGDRARLLHQYLHDQMELVAVGADDAEELHLLHPPTPTAAQH